MRITIHHTDDETWVSHPGNVATEQYVRVLVARAQCDATPIWKPLPVLFGPSGVGKTALIAHIRANQDRLGLGHGDMPLEPTVECVGQALQRLGTGGDLVFLDNADRLLTITPRRRLAVIQAISAWPEAIVGLIGSPKLVEVLSQDVSIDPIPLFPIAPGPAFQAVVSGLLLSQADGLDLDQLYRQTGGIMGLVMRWVADRTAAPPMLPAP